MSIPGLSIPGLGGHSAPVVALSAPATVVGIVTVYELQANSEWRFEVAVGQSIEVKVLSGTAEIFGTELALNHIYTFRAAKSAIYTWHGCRLEVTGVCEEYTAEETPMISYINTHFALEKLRDEAEMNKGEGPRVLVVGPSNSGKTSLVKLLTAYAIRMGRQPMVINTDSREGILSIPGSLTATPFASIIDVEEGWGSSPTSGPSAIPVKLPLCYYYGLPSPEDNTKLYKPVITRLALASSGRLAKDDPIRQTGMIIDSPGSISESKHGQELIAHIVGEFSVNAILVMGNERLHSDMARRFSNHGITIVKLDKSGGCVQRDLDFMRKSQEVSIREYFYGDAKRTLSPMSLQISFDAAIIYKIREPNSTQYSFLPGGEEETDSSLYEKVEPSSLMVHCILGVMHAGLNDSQETIRDSTVKGFVCVTKVNESKRHFTVLAPLNTTVADRPMIWGSWPEATLSLE